MLAKEREGIWGERCMSTQNENRATRDETNYLDSLFCPVLHLGILLHILLSL